MERGEGRKPGVDVGELLLEVVALLAADRADQLADLLDEPEQRARHAARGIALEVDPFDQRLEVGVAFHHPTRFAVTSRTSSRSPSGPASLSS